MSRWWARWVAHVNRPVDARPLRWVRILVPLALLWDLLSMAVRGAGDAALFPATFGGIGESANWYLLEGRWWGGPLLWGLLVVALPLASAGYAARAALVVAVVADAQLGHLFVGGDRGIDRILRTVLLILLFSRISGPGRPERVPAWPSDLLRWLLAIVYLGAGMSKVPTAARWLDFSQPELYTILTDPLAGRLDPVFWAAHPLPFWLGGAATLAVELSAPLLLTRWAPIWAGFACFIHLGIAATMDLGMFPWGMLALYPVLVGPYVLRRWDAWRRQGAAEGSS